MKQLAKLFEARLKMTFRDKGVWFWTISYPVILMVIFLFIFGGQAGGGDGLSARVAVVKEQDGPVAAAFEQMLRQMPMLMWETEQAVDRAEAERLVLDKAIDAYIALPDGQSSTTMELIVHREKEQSPTTQALTAILREVTGNFGRETAPVYGLDVRSVSAGSDSLAYIDFLVTGMIALSICQAGLFGMSGLVEMRRNGLLKRLRLTPVNMTLFGVGDMLVRFLLAAVQIVLLGGIGALFFNATYEVAPLALFLTFATGTLSFSAIGYAAASFAKSMESFMGIVNIASFVMMFLSGVFFELSMLPGWLQPVSSVLPLTYFVNGIRDSMLYGSGVANPAFWLNMGVLVLWMLAAFATGTKFYRWKPEKA